MLLLIGLLSATAAEGEEPDCADRRVPALHVRSLPDARSRILDPGRSDEVLRSWAHLIKRFALQSVEVGRFSQRENPFASAAELVKLDFRAYIDYPKGDQMYSLGLVTPAVRERSEGSLWRINSTC